MEAGREGQRRRASPEVSGRTNRVSGCDGPGDGEPEMGMVNQIEMAPGETGGGAGRVVSHFEAVHSGGVGGREVEESK